MTPDWTHVEYDAPDGETVTMLTRGSDYIELEFIDQAFRLRDTDADAFEGVWTLLTLLLERGAPGEGLNA